MKFTPSVALLSMCGLAVIVPAQAHAMDGAFLAARDAVQQDRNEARQSRRTKGVEQPEPQAQQPTSAQESRHQSEGSYGYGYERRHHEGNDGRGRR